ncbi:hypothetical protein PoB_006460000 [Plakobranchus ocellatus]|uniref:Uncharacterized protein n=1 Tax=Plakobranchus ocellatus TaxID=259542 RepID=A0AAV4D1Y1_9GAST|nr:hypothetical protein PoB_006460000 [Plakobranchus ocellatus]
MKLVFRRSPESAGLCLLPSPVCYPGQLGGFNRKISFQAGANIYGLKIWDSPENMMFVARVGTVNDVQTPRPVDASVNKEQTQGQYCGLTKTKRYRKRQKLFCLSEPFTQHLRQSTHLAEIICSCMQIAKHPELSSGTDTGDCVTHQESPPSSLVTPGGVGDGTFCPEAQGNCGQLRGVPRRTESCQLEGEP